MVAVVLSTADPWSCKHSSSVWRFTANFTNSSPHLYSSNISWLSVARAWANRHWDDSSERRFQIWPLLLLLDSRHGISELWELNITAVFTQQSRNLPSTVTRTLQIWSFLLLTWRQFNTSTNAFIPSIRHENVIPSASSSIFFSKWVFVLRKRGYCSIYNAAAVFEVGGGSGFALVGFC